MNKNFKRFLAVLICLCLVISFAACSNTAKNDPVTLKIGTTTSVNDSGLLEFLAPEIKKDTGITMDIVAQGSGQVIAGASNGDFDAIIVHSPADEQKFVDSGAGVDRVSFMYNYFTIVGPSSDSAKVKGSTSAKDAFTKIVDSKSVFVSRGDESGTHKKELKIWQDANIDASKLSSDIYYSVGKGMGDTLTMTSEKQAYTLTDKATYLSMKDKLKLDILLEESEDLKNTYSIILVNPDKFSNVNFEASKRFKDWFMSSKAKKLINEYGKSEYGEQLFFYSLEK